MQRSMVVAVLFFFALAVPARAADAPPKPKTVPFELLKTKHIVVKIKINGKGPYRVIFDTGAPLSLINNKIAKESGMIAKKVKPSIFNPFGALGPTKIKTLELGDVKIENTSAIVMDHPTVELMSKAMGPIAGIIGFPFFSRFRMTIDYQAKQMTLMPNGYQPSDALETMITNIMALAEDEPPRRRILKPAAQWGLVVHKRKTDEDAGVTIHEVLAGSAAAAGGLQAGDRLLTLDGRWTDTVADAYRAAGHVPPGKAVKVRIQRRGKAMELTVTPRPGL